MWGACAACCCLGPARCLQTYAIHWSRHVQHIGRAFASRQHVESESMLDVRVAAVKRAGSPSRHQRRRDVDWITSCLQAVCRCRCAFRVAGHRDRHAPQPATGRDRAVRVSGQPLHAAGGWCNPHCAARSQGQAYAHGVAMSRFEQPTVIARLAQGAAVAP